MIVTVSIEIDFEPSDGETPHLGTRKVEQTVRYDGWEAVAIGISDALKLANVPRQSQTIAEFVIDRLDYYGEADYLSLYPEANVNIHAGRKMMEDGARKVIAAFNEIDEIILD